jgi:hypothetical protein
MDPNYDNPYNRSILQEYFKLAQLQKNPKYVQQNWETDIIRNMPWGNYGEYRTHNYKTLSSGGNIAKHISQKKVFKQPIKLIELGQRQNVPKIIIPRQVVHETVSKITVGQRPTLPLATKPYINLRIADLEDKKSKPKSNIQLLARLL